MKFVKNGVQIPINSVMLLAISIVSFSDRPTRSVVVQETTSGREGKEQFVSSRESPTIFAKLMIIQCVLPVFSFVALVIQEAVSTKHDLIDYSSRLISFQWGQSECPDNTRMRGTAGSPQPAYLSLP